MKSEVSSGGNRLQITRSLNAPRALVFGWWADAEKYSQWSGCKEAVSCDVAMDFRVGGSFTQKMQIAVNGGICDFTITGVYDEIVEPERIGYHAKLGNVDVQVTVEFIEEGKGTKVVVTHVGLPNEFFAGNINRGTLESFDKLEPLVARQAVAAAQ